MRSFVTPGVHGYSVQFSPFAHDVLACVGGQQYGISGQGALFVLGLSDEGIKLQVNGEWSDTLFDVSWSENSDKLIVCAGGDGSIQVWDTSIGLQGSVALTPVKVFREHTLEVNSVCWSCPRGCPQQVLSASWDSTVKLWDVDAGSVSLRTFRSHNGPAYSAKWSPHLPGVFASVGGDGTVALCDVRAETALQNIFPAHQAEILCCDWNKYNHGCLVTGSVDGTVRGWDSRKPSQPLFILHGHKLAVRRVCCSPHSAERFVTSSYDCTVRFWSAHGEGGLGKSACLEELKHHTEFVYGLDCSVHNTGLVSDCSWDSSVRVYQAASLLAT